MDIIEMTDEEFAKEFMRGILRSGPMTEDDIALALDKAMEYRFGALMLGILMDGKVNVEWDGKQFIWSGAKPIPGVISKKEVKWE